jgi:hypothetical protein
MVEQMILMASFKNSENPGMASLVFSSRKTVITSNAIRSIASKLSEGLNMLKFITAIDVKNGRICRKILAEKALRKKQSP